MLKFQYRYVEQDFRDINMYLSCLDDMVDFLDEEDELAGLPNGVLEAQEKLYEYFVELYRLRNKAQRSKYIGNRRYVAIDDKIMDENILEEICHLIKY